MGSARSAGLASQALRLFHFFPSPKSSVCLAPGVRPAHFLATNGLEKPQGRRRALRYFAFDDDKKPSTASLARNKRGSSASNSCLLIRFGIGGAVARPPCHTTVRTGPYTAVRWVQLVAQGSLLKPCGLSIVFVALITRSKGVRKTAGPKAALRYNSCMSRLRRPFVAGRIFFITNNLLRTRRRSRRLISKP